MTQPERTPWEGVLGDTLAEALGQTRRADAVLPRTGGPAGNARLTAWTGLLILVLAVIELVTLLDVQGLIGWHVVVGCLLVPPALLKTATTGWRIVRYYRGTPVYVSAGPPPLLLRVLGPGVVLSTIGLLGSGLLLIVLGQDRARTDLLTLLGQRIDWVTVHQGLFLVWGVLTGVHVLARLVPAAQRTVVSTSGSPRVDGRVARGAALAGTAILAVVLAVLVLSASSSWREHGGDFGEHNSAHDRRSVGS